MPMFKQKMSRRLGAALAGVTLAGTGLGGALLFAGGANASVKAISFNMVRSTASVKANCLVGASAQVSVTRSGPVETMKVNGEKLVRTEKEVVVEQQPTVAKDESAPDRPPSAPSLRRPGESLPTDDPAAPKPTGPSSAPPAAPPDMGGSPPSGPN